MPCRKPKVIWEIGGEIALGKRAQELLKATTHHTGKPEDFDFSPQRAEAQRQVSRKKANTKRKPGRYYSTHGVAVAVARACKKATVPHWHPNQLRHLYATAVRRVYGLEAAQVLLGHANADVTQVYAERDMELAAKVAGEIG